MLPGCSLWVQEVDTINTNLRLNWTLSGFYSTGGAQTFQQNLAASLNIYTSQVIINSVTQGSVIVGFQIVSPIMAANANTTADLLTVKQQYLKQIQT